LCRRIKKTGKVSGLLEKKALGTREHDKKKMELVRSVRRKGDNFVIEEKANSKGKGGSGVIVRKTGTGNRNLENDREVAEVLKQLGEASSNQRGTGKRKSENGGGIGYAGNAIRLH